MHYRVLIEVLLAELPQCLQNLHLNIVVKWVILARKPIGLIYVYAGREQHPRRIEVHIYMELELALVLFDGSSVNSDYVADVFGLWTVLRFFGIEDAAHVLVA